MCVYYHLPWSGTADVNCLKYWKSADVVRQSPVMLTEGFFCGWINHWTNQSFVGGATDLPDPGYNLMQYKNMPEPRFSLCFSFCLSGDLSLNAAH